MQGSLLVRLVEYELPLEQCSDRLEIDDELRAIRADGDRRAPGSGGPVSERQIVFAQFRGRGGGIALEPVRDALVSQRQTPEAEPSGAQIELERPFLELCRSRRIARLDQIRIRLDERVGVLGVAPTAGEQQAPVIR